MATFSACVMRIARLSLLLFACSIFAPAAQAETESAARGSSHPVILVMGDSISAEYGLVRGKGWVALLTQKLAGSHANYQLVNASVSGETTSGGVSRLPALLAEHQPAIVIIELGSNDALRGLSLAMSERNLNTMTQAAQDAGATVLIAGMQIPPNYGPSYTERFKKMFADVAHQHQAALIPFLLQGIAEDTRHFQADTIHPNEDAQPTLLANVWRVLEPLLSLPEASPAALIQQ